MASDEASLVEGLRSLSERVQNQSLAEAGEGFVVYLTEGHERAMVIFLGKLKTKEYRLLRLMREKAKVFARSGGGLLVEDVVKDFEDQGHAVKLQKRLAAAFEVLCLRLCRLIFQEDLSPEEVDDPRFLSPPP